MTREEVEEMMKDAGLKPPARGAFIFIHWDQIAMLLDYQRAKCAQKCMDIAAEHLPVSDFAMGKHDGALDCADAIEGMK